MIARVTVRLKQDVMDPQGTAVLAALHSLGHQSVTNVRVGRHFDIDLLPGTNAEQARQALAAMADQLLANPVIEDFEITVEEGASR
jgi:phosphoribosylformylglycinamidine synthase PurS subunit